MSDADLNKLKVTELKEELKKRGIDSKGNKAQLIQKLKKALKEERNEGGADDSEGAGDVSLEGGDSQYDSALESSQNESNLDSSWNKADEKPVEEKPVDEFHAKSVPTHFVGLSESSESFVNKDISAVDLLESTVQAEPEHVVPTSQPKTLFEPVTAELSVVKESVAEPAVEPAVAQERRAVQPEADKHKILEEQISKMQSTEEPATESVPVAKSTVEQISKKALKTEEAPVKIEAEDTLTVKAEKEQQGAETVELQKQTKDVEMESTEEKPDAADEEKKVTKSLELEDSSVVLVEDSDVPEKEADEKPDVDMEIIDGSDSAKEKRGEKRRRSRSRSRSRSPDKHRDWSYRSRSKSPKRGRHSRSRSKSHSRSRSRDRSQERRQYRSRSRSQEKQRDQSKSPDKSVVEVPENDDWITSTDVQVDRYNCDLSVVIDDNGRKVTPLESGGFVYMWHGVKSTYGVSKGKAGYEVKILEHLSVDLPDEEESKHVVRVGFSIDAASTQLGEEKFSYGYGGTGRASTECKFTSYGNPFEAGDVIGAYVDFESDPVVISYTKNGEDLGTAFEIPADSLEGRALFPHILTKNCSFECNFGQLEEPFFPVKEGFTFLNAVTEEDRVRSTLPPAQKEDCEMLMMCGLPGSGKTYWATKHSEANPEKRYTILGTNNIIDKMKVMGLPRKRNYHGRWDVLINLSTKCLNRLLTVSARKKRNFILDQTNVYPSAQRRKMRPFEGFQRTAVVIVPTDEEFKRRCEQREKEEGKEVPDSAVLEMKANFQLPTEEFFDKVQFVELEKDEAQALVEQYNREGKQASSGGRQYRGNDRNQSYDNRSNRSYGSYSGSQEHGRDGQKSWGYNNRRGGGGGGGGGGYYNRDNRDGGGYGNKRGGGGYGGSGGYGSGGGGGGYGGGGYGGGGGFRRNDRGSGGGGYNQPDRRRDQSSWSSGGGGGYRDRRDNRGSSSGGRDSSWGGNRSSSGYQQQPQSSWKSQGSQGGARNTYGQNQQGSWGNQGTGSQTGSSWGAASTPSTGWNTQQDWSQQTGYQQPTWGQWTPYNQQPQQQQQVQQQPQQQQQQQATAAWNQQYWNSWNAYSQAQQGNWDYSQYGAQGGAQK